VPSPARRQTVGRPARHPAAVTAQEAAARASTLPRSRSEVRGREPPGPPPNPLPSSPRSTPENENENENENESRPPSAAAPTARSGSARGPCALRREGPATATKGRKGGGGGGLHVRAVRRRAVAEQEVHFDQAQRLDGEPAVPRRVQASPHRPAALPPAARPGRVRRMRLRTDLPCVRVCCRGCCRQPKSVSASLPAGAALAQARGATGAARVAGSRVRVAQNFLLRVQGSGCRVQGAGCRVQGCAALLPRVKELQPPKHVLAHGRPPPNGGASAPAAHAATGHAACVARQHGAAAQEGGAHHRHI